MGCVRVNLCCKHCWRTRNWWRSLVFVVSQKAGRRTLLCTNSTRAMLDIAASYGTLSRAAADAGLAFDDNDEGTIQR